MNNILGIIPARGGSKSVPKKNIRLINGKPLIAYTIEEAAKSDYLTSIIVSTDCEETIKISKNLGAEAPFLRPKELAGDFVRDLPVCEHVLSWLVGQKRELPDTIVWLRPTSPIRKVSHIDASIKLLLKNPEADSVRSVCLAPKHPLKMWRINDNKLEPFISEAISGIREAYNYPRQKLPPAFVQNGAIDVISRNTILGKKSMTGDIILPYIMDEFSSLNIDSPMDFMMAEILFQQN